jgi:hypothetical protein
VNVVKQRLRIAAVSEKLLDVYAEDGMSLEQLMAFTVTTDRARQEQVWEALQRSYNQESYQIPFGQKTHLTAFSCGLLMIITQELAQSLAGRTALDRSHGPEEIA